MKRVCIIFGMVWCALAMRAGVVLSDSIRFSVLTCCPGQEIYRMWGHTAIRYQNLTKGQDLVFNFGMFDFDKPHFVYLFVRGLTDYELGIESFDQFNWLYSRLRAKVQEQVLDLTDDEKWHLWQILEHNYREENRTYRYNFYSNNCTTRARDRVEEALDAPLTYPDVPQTTFRNMVHGFTTHSAWYEFGIDLLLGADADKQIGGRQQMFAPFFFHDMLAQARKQSGDPFVQSECMLLDGDCPQAPAGFPLAPLPCAWMLLAICVALLAYSMWRGRQFPWAVTTFLYLLQGTAGILVAFLTFFSEHPTVDSNWLVGVFNPIPLVVLPWVISHGVHRRYLAYHVFKAIWMLLCLLAMPFLLQQFPTAVYPIVLCLMACAFAQAYTAWRYGKK